MQQFNCVRRTCSRPYSTSTVAIAMTTAKPCRKFFGVTSLRAAICAACSIKRQRNADISSPANTLSRARPPTWELGRCPGESAGDKGSAQIPPWKPQGRPCADPSRPRRFQRGLGSTDRCRCDVFTFPDGRMDLVLRPHQHAGRLTRTHASIRCHAGASLPINDNLVQPAG